MLFVFIGISEIDFDEGAATSWVVENRSHNSSDISLTLSEIEVSISGRSDPLGLGSSVDTTFFTLSLA